MIESIKMNLELLESMLFYWKATSEKEKVGEPFIYSIANHPNMKYAYDAEFEGESVRKALSAISNREIFAPKTKKEGRFWNNNMWMLEDLGLTEEMVKPLKVLNLDDLKDRSKNTKSESSYKDLEIIVIPGHFETSYIDKANAKIILNFFKIKIDLNDGNCYVEDMPIGDYILSLI